MFYLAVLFILDCSHCFSVIVKWNGECFKMLKPRACEYGSNTHKKWDKAECASRYSQETCSAEGHSVRCNLFIDNLQQWCNEPVNTTKVMNPFLFK